MVVLAARVTMEVFSFRFRIMPPTTDTDREVLKAIADLSQKVSDQSQRVSDLSQKVSDLSQRVSDLSQRVEVGFAQVDTKLADLRGEMNVKFAKIEGDIALLRQPRDFTDFLKRAIASGLVVTVVGGLLLATGKFFIFGIQ